MTTQQHYLDLMGIDVWVRRDLPVNPVIDAVLPTQVVPPTAPANRQVLPTAKTPEQLQHYLQLMGVDVWVRRDVLTPALANPIEVVPEPVAQQSVSTPVISASSTTTPAAVLPPTPDVAASIPHEPVISASDTISHSTPPAAAPEAPEPTTPPITEIKPKPVSIPVDINPIALLDWAALRAKVATCTACGLHQHRTQTVFGVGDEQASWMVIGEAPGGDEDRQGEPFVGRAGQLLNAMLYAIGLQRQQVYIANIVKCRPPQNRNPDPEEVHCCTPFLERQIELLQPKIILAVGKIAAQYLLNSDAPIGKLRGKPFEYAGVPLIVTYHPAYLLRRPSEKSKAWTDLQLACRLLERSEAQS